MSSTTEFDQAARDMRRTETEGTEGIFDARELIRYASLAASSHNTQPWKFRIRKDRITILPDYARRCSVVDPDDSHLFKSLGCAAENLLHAAAAQGFSAEIQFDSAHNSIDVFLTPDVAACATDLFRAIPKRQCVKAPFDGNLLETGELEKLMQAGEGQSVRTIILTSEREKNLVVGYVTRGNIAQLSDRRFRKELIDWIRFNPAEALRTGDGLAGYTSGQPALPTWLGKMSIGLVLTPKAQVKTDAANIKSSAGIAVFVSNRDDITSWVEIGRAYERFALQATALSIRTAFINQPIEVRELRSEFEAWLNLEGEHALLMVRFGHGPTMPFSLRRPIDDVIVAE